MTDKMSKMLILFVLVLVMCGTAFAEKLVLDERPANTVKWEVRSEDPEWGYRPVEGAVLAVNPPSFIWRIQDGLVWEVQCARDKAFKKIEYRAKDIKYNVHCPPRVLKPGRYSWRYRGKDTNGDYTNWSQIRTFTIAEDAAKMPMPRRKELLSRIPKKHPRLFVRPENLKHLRKLAKGQLKDKYDELVEECEKILADPPPTEEPQTYPESVERMSEQWRKIWWGNRVYTIKALNSAATLAFTRLLGGQEKYGLEAKRILMECAKWDPKGSTGYRYNDEAGMPYNYYFSRTYSFVNDLLSREEKEICRRVMKVRGDEMYKHLNPRHLWRPYASHSNRAWHFLGEVGLAFFDEVEGADEWVWFAMNVFYNVYPVWSDDDGGWHEGMSYWASYQNRFTWWADIMREALGVSAYDKPYYSKAGYFPMYLMPPGKVGGGFGDGAARRKASRSVPLMSVLAAQAGDGYWQWWVEQNGGPKPTAGYIGFIRGALPKVESIPPHDLPTSRLFSGIGQAYLNTNLTDAGDSVQVVFKSSPFGTQSHNSAANNSFLLWAYGQRLLIRSGHYDSYGSAHHTGWVWSARSVNNITVSGIGQRKRSAAALGEIVAFKTTPAMDIVVGEAGKSYENDILDRYTRAIIFVKPDLVVVYDRLVAKEPSTYKYWLHALNKIDVDGQHHIRVKSEDVACDIDFLTPGGLTFTQTDRYDPEPRRRYNFREWHLTAKTQEKKNSIEFVTLYRPHRIEDQLPHQADLEKINGGYALKVKLSDGHFTALLPTDDNAQLQAYGLKSKGKIKAWLKRENNPVEILGLEE